MVSDVLYDAAAEVRAYLRDLPEVYAALRPQIEAWLRETDLLHMTLDHPPVAGEEPITPTRN